MQGLHDKVWVGPFKYSHLNSVHCLQVEEIFTCDGKTCNALVGLRNVANGVDGLRDRVWVGPFKHGHHVSQLHLRNAATVIQVKALHPATRKWLLLYWNNLRQE